MIFLKSINDFHIDEPTVLTLGKFDGLHMGHKKILENVAQKKNEGLKSVIFTFDTTPADSIYHTATRQLTTLPEKELCFSNVGIDYFLECPFTDEIRKMSARDFIRMCVRNLSVKCFVVGTDCGFGYKRSGNCSTLLRYAEEFGYETVIVEKKQYEGRDISSTFIREEIEKGNIEKANLLLGYPFFIMEEVKSGNRLGRTIGFPTINQIPSPKKLLPPYGVYASCIAIGDDVYKGVSNIGVKPTIKGKNALSLETNIFDFSEDIYGKTVRVRLYSFIRPEKKFDSLDELKIQIAADALKAKEILDNV